MSRVYTRFGTVVKDERFDYCEHLSFGDMSHATFCEDDSFGPVARYCVCEVCYKQTQEALATCPTCGSSVKTSQLRNWMPYDYDSSAGDHVYELCELCCTSPEHQLRVSRDRDMMNREFDNDY